MLTTEQANQLVEHVVAEVRAGRMSEEQGKAYAQRLLNEAFALRIGVPAAAPAQPDYAADYVAPDSTRVAVRLMAEDGLSRAQIADRLERNGIDAELQERIDKRQAFLLERHVETQAAIAADSPDARKQQAQARLKAAEDLKRDALLARDYIVAEGVLPEDLADELTDQEAIDTAFGDKNDPRAEANNLQANLAKIAEPKPKQWTLDGGDAA